MRGEGLCRRGLAERRQAGEFAFMAVDTPAQSLSGIAISETEAVDSRRRGETFIAAVKRAERAVLKYAMAVLHIVAAAVRGIKQRVLPIRVKQRG